MSTIPQTGRTIEPTGLEPDPMTAQTPAVAAAMRHRSTPARMARTALMLSVAALLAACIYRLPIRQGNYLDPAAIAQIKPGMTHSQVRYLLGTPMVPEGFDNGRWDYDYYLNDHSHKPRHAHATIYFANDLVARVQSDVQRPPVTTVTRRGVPIPNSF
jgi:outer membrane protein assembly factor BamE